MAATVAEIEALLKARDELSAQIRRAASNVEKETGRMQAAFDRTAARMTSMGKSMTRGVTMPLLAAGAGMVHLVGVQEEAEAKLSATFESMGASAWTTTDALKAQASALQGLTTYGDEAILEMQGVLLTFGQVTNQTGEMGDVFDRATSIGLDMSARLGQDLQTSAVQVGKALNDPIAGVTALQRVGVQFTKSQKDMIKSLVESGDVLGAQNTILAELERQFEGSAEAVASTSKGKLTQAMNRLGDVAESFGALLLPMIEKMAGWLGSLSDWFDRLSPQTKQMIINVAGVAAAIGPLLLIGGKLVGAISAISHAFRAMSTLMSTNPYALLIAATVALVALIVANWDTIKETLGKAWEWVSDRVASVADWVTQKWATIVDATSNVVDWVTGKFRGMVDWLKNLFLNWTLPGLIMRHWITIKANLAELVRFVHEKWDNLISWFGHIPGRVGDAFRGVADTIIAAFRSAFNWIARLWNDTVGSLSFRAPSWIPGIGGKGWDVPDIPTFHQGGVVPGTPGQEVIAKVQAGETILPVGTSAPTIGQIIFNEKIDPMATVDLIMWRLRTAGI